jgi:hypothetical protein
MFFGCNCCGKSRYFWIRKYPDASVPVVDKEADAPQALRAPNPPSTDIRLGWPVAFEIIDVQNSLQVGWSRVFGTTRGYAVYSYDLEYQTSVTFDVYVDSNGAFTHTNGVLYGIGYWAGTAWSIKAVNTSGSTVWTFSVPASESLTGLQFDSQNNLYATSYKAGSLLTPNQSFTYKFNSTGAVQWKQVGAGGPGRPTIASDDYLYQSRRVYQLTVPPFTPEYQTRERWSPTGSYTSAVSNRDSLIANKSAEVWTLYGAFASTTKTISKYTTALAETNTITITDPYFAGTTNIACLDGDAHAFVGPQSYGRLNKYRLSNAELLWTWIAVDDIFERNPPTPLWGGAQCFAHRNGYVYAAGSRRSKY